MLRAFKKATSSLFSPQHETKQKLWIEEAEKQNQLAR